MKQLGNVSAYSILLALVDQTRLLLHYVIIGVGTRGAGGARAPQYFTLETLLIFMHAAQIAVITVYITFGPPKMELLPTPMCHDYEHDVT